MRNEETLDAPLQQFFAEVLNKKINTVGEALAGMREVCAEYDLSTEQLESLHLEDDFRLLCEMILVLTGREDDGLLTDAVKELLKEFPARYRPNTHPTDENQPARKVFLFPKENDEHLLYLQDLIKGLQDRGYKYTINKVAIAVYLKDRRHFEYNRPYYDPSSQQVFGELIFLLLPKKEQLSFLPPDLVANKITGDRAYDKTAYITPLTVAEFLKIVLNLKYDWEQETYRLDPGQ